MTQMMKMETTNEKNITRAVVNNRFPHLSPFEDDIVGVVREVHSEIASEVEAGNKVLVKNFGTFQKKERTTRRRYDQGMKKTVITEPITIVDFVQSPNIFRKK